jgi:hypothetical protein
MISNDISQLTELENLSEEERKLVLNILEEYSNSGKSEKYDNLIYEDYEEIPVTIEEFLHNPKYLGKGLINEEGKFTVFPYWENLLKEIFPDPLKPAKYNTLALTGSIGIGKSFIAVITGLYELYRMLCLKDPYLHYGLQPIDKITFAFMNITMDAAKGVAWDKCQQLLQSSEWFMSKGNVSKGNNPTWSPPKGIELIYGSQSRHIIGRAVYWCFQDEVSFQQNIDVNKQKEKAKTLVNTAAARMQSRFMKGEKNPTLLVLASSKRTEQSFMETFIDGKKKQDSKTIKIVDEPQWVIRTDKDSPNKFKVAVGNKFLSSEVLPLNYTEKDLEIARNRGYTLLDVPMGYYENFIDDIDIALTDIAGISTSSTNRYISGVRLANVKTDSYKNAFKKEIIEVGNAKEDTAQYKDFFDINLIPREIRSKPLYIHMDMSKSGDKTGIAGVFIKGKKPTPPGEPPSKDLFFTLGFSVSVKAPKGYEVSYEKNRNFIYWLREQGLNIKGISTDTFQSVDTGQQLSAKNFNYCVISADRVDSDRICKPYQYLRSTIYEERIEIYNNELLTDELIGLERDNNSGKIDHSPSGINCFTGDTKIQLVDGRILTILELKKEFDNGIENFVYSFNHSTNKIEARPVANVFKSGENASLVEVKLDNGEIIHCTPNHRFMLRDGSYCEAKDLQENQSLMPLYTKISKKGLNGYRLYYEPMEECWHYEHREFCTEVDDEKHLVHHKDCNKLNNNPTNLVWCSKIKHQQIHANTQTGAHSPEAERKRSESIKKYHDTNKNNPEYWTRYEPYKNMSPEDAYKAHIYKETVKENKAQIRKEKHDANRLKIECQKNKQFEMAKKYGINIDSLQGTELQSLMIKYAHEIDPSYQAKVTKAVSENHKLGKYTNAYKALQKCNANRKGKHRPKSVIEKIIQTRLQHGPYEVSEETRKKLSESTKRRSWYNNGETNIYIDKDSPIPDGYVHGRIKTWKNHKVVSVTNLQNKEDVYDITIDETHNFALAAGVFVHNSKDQADAVCGALWNASQHAEQFAFDYGETLETVTTINNSGNNYSQEQILIDLENEMKQTFSRPVKKDDDSNFINFGLGKAKPLTTQYLANGIALW